MVKILTAPNRYIQGSGVINDFAKYMAHLGSRPFILGGRTALSVIRESVEKSVSENGMECTFVEFTGKGTRQDTSELVSKATEFGGDVIVGIGGGLALDMAKAVVYEMNLPLVSVPTIASTDAPCSAEALQYLDNHQLDRVIILKKNPDVVLVDSKIIAEAPTRFFVAGMGDALATWNTAWPPNWQSIKTPQHRPLKWSLRQTLF
jgi:glycerol dehydrogenase